MDIRQLRYFVAVTEHLNFSKAASHLHISQSTLSQQIAQLEQQIGVQLFIRNSRTVKLTSAGAAFIEEAKDLISMLAEAITLTRQAEFSISGTLKIGLLAGVRQPFWPKLIATLRQKYPDIYLFIETFDIDALDKAIRKNKVDIGITISPGLSQIPNIIYKKFCTENVCLVIARNHPLINKVTIDFSVLKDELFLFDGSSRGLEHLLQICAKRGIFPTISLERGIEAVLLLIEARAGVSLLPQTVSKAYNRPNLVYINLETEDSTIDIVTTWKSTNTNPCISLFLNELELLNALYQCPADPPESATPVFNSCANHLK